MCDDIQSKGDTHTCAYLYLYTYYIIIVCVGGWCGCLYILYNYVYETETAKRAGTSEKDMFFSKNPGFLNFTKFPLVHFPMKSCLWCSKFNNVVIACCQCLVPCRARDFVGKLFLHFSNACPTTVLRLKCSDKQCQFLHTRSIRNNLNCVIATITVFTMSKRPVFSWNLSAQRIGPKKPIMAAETKRVEQQ